MRAIATINWNAHNALIDEPDGRIFTLDHNDPTPTEQSQSFHRGMYLQPGMNKEAIEERDAGEYPYTGIYDSLKKSYSKQNGLRMFLYGIDADFELEFRAYAMKSAETFLSDPEVKAFVLERLLGNSLGDKALVNFEGLPKDGNVGEVIKAFREKWGL